jgi:tetratricopeptide (TPR) repeat protein
MKKIHEIEDEKQKLEEEQAIKDKKKKLKLRIQQTISGIIFFGLIVTIGLGIVGFDQYCKAKKQTLMTEYSEYKAKKSQLEFIDGRYLNFFENATKAAMIPNYDLAINNFEEALNFIHTDTAFMPDTNIISCNIVTSLFAKKSEAYPEVPGSEANQIRDQFIKDSTVKADQLNDSIIYYEGRKSRKSSIDSILLVAKIELDSKNYFNAMELYKKAHHKDKRLSDAEDGFEVARKEALKAYKKEIDFYKSRKDKNGMNQAKLLREEVDKTELKIK